MVILELKYPDLNTYLNHCFNLEKEKKKLWPWAEIL